MLRKRLTFAFLFAVMLSLIAPMSTAQLMQGEPDYCDLYPEYCEEGGEEEPGGGTGEVWDGYTDGRINPDQAEYYTIYCHAGTDTIYVVRVVPETQTIKTIALADAISLPIGGEQALGDFMVMVRNGENTITIYGSNGNLAPQAGSKAFSLADCIAANGGSPALSDFIPPPNDGGEPPQDAPETEAEALIRRQREAQEQLDFCYESYDFFGGDSELLAWCLDDVLSNYNDVLSGEVVLTMILMVFCLNLIVGNGILPIGIVVLLGWHRRWLRRQKTL